jgi:hypothetical protein
MQSLFIRAFLSMVLWALLGCSGTTTELPGKLDDLRVKIDAEHLTDLTGSRSYARHSIRAVLTNAKGSDIERSDVKIEVNGLPMRFRVGQGNYHDRHPYYLLDGDDRLELNPGTEYRFILILPDGARHNIGTLRTPAALSPEQFDFPKTPPGSSPVTFAWRNLAEPVQLRIGRAEQRRDADGNSAIVSSGPNDPDALRRTIDPGAFRRHTGRLVLPEQLLVSTPDRKLLWLLAEITVASESRTSSSFSRQSAMRAVRRIQLNMQFAAID